MLNGILMKCKKTFVQISSEYFSSECYSNFLSALIYLVWVSKRLGRIFYYFLQYPWSLERDLTLRKLYLKFTCIFLELDCKILLSSFLLPFLCDPANCSDSHKIINFIIKKSKFEAFSLDSNVSFKINSRIASSYELTIILKLSGLFL